MNVVLKEQWIPSGQRLQLVQGDLTQEAVDAIVNAANDRLQHGGGLAAAIARAGGPQIQAESDAWVREHGPVAHARPACTTAGRMPSRFVIHAVGPVWGAGQEDEKLSAAVLGSLRLAGELGLHTIALPAISTGIFGFPKDRAARIILQAILDYFAENPESTLQQIRLTLYDQPTVDVFQEVWESFFQGDRGAGE